MPLSFSLPLFPAILLALALIVIVYLLLHATKLKTGEQSFTRQIEDLNQQIITLQQANATLQRDLQQNINEQITLKTALNAREVKLAELINEQHSLQQSFDKLQQEKNLLTADKAALVAQLQAQKSLQAESSRREEVARHELEARLQQWGQKMLQERGVALNKQSAEQLNNVVGPLTEELKQFRSQLTLNQKIQSEQAGSLKTELTKLQQAQQSLSKQADDLTKALTAGAKAQGLWGEHQLELCLDSAGLKLNETYAREVVSKESGENGRPDVIVYLPRKHCLIIDAKCSLTDYARYMAADANPSEKLAALKAHVASIKRHINELSKKRYDSYLGFNSPSFVFMFVPIDGALSEAYLQDKELYQYAALNNVYLVSPSTLIPALKVAANLWIIATQNDKVRQIAAQAQKIYQKLELINEAFAEVRQRQTSLQNSLDKLDTRLCSGKGNLNTMLKNFAYQAPQELQALDDSMLPDMTKQQMPLKNLQEQPVLAKATSQELV
ncbi:MAG: DNA recombination protein RmuC [Candidatus Anaerobiospirillum merdipullorum]|uniref:DNA recombination protein RmuC n=1 Tax=Candidatus Anaerobiospirillum merdipullorum TaxID=2838450 RepID=A0A9E2NSR0_9GAMM|nr:DNA recombination protein RmuC [Candidatus Anaerobiospirillum merdipullorum]